MGAGPFGCFEVTFAAGSSTNKGGLVCAHDGDDTFYAVVLERTSPAYIVLYQVTNGSWSSLTSARATVAENTAYTIEVRCTQRRVEANVVGQSSASISKNSTALWGVGQAGLCADKTGVKFDDLVAIDRTGWEPQFPRLTGQADSAIITGWLHVYDGVLEVEGFTGTDYTFEGLVTNPGNNHIWVRRQDANNGYVVRADFSGGKVKLIKYLNGMYHDLGSNSITGLPTPCGVKIKLEGSTIAVWVHTTQKLSITDSDITHGGVAFDEGAFSSGKIYYDVNDDDDYDAGTDYLHYDEDFDSNSTTIAHDKAGNLVDDGTFTYTYDAWHRLVKATSAEDSDVTISQYRYDAKGRRIKKVVTNTGRLDGTELLR